ncbi:MAG: TlpA family protein disulfide reductase [Solimicrobium sp.]|jgi:peroxiredoxin|nr:TlpA family protein disulfide reductase [Solimicrobium sp.]
MRFPGSFLSLLSRLLSTLFLILFFTLSGCSKQTAPDVNFTDLKGNSSSLTQLKGKVVLVNFWSTSCRTCVTEMPELVKTYEKFHPQGLELVAIAMSYDPPNYVLNFTQSNQLPFPVALDLGGKLAHSFDDVKLTPTTFLINKQGNIIKKFVGKPDFVKLYQLLDAELSL